MSTTLKQAAARIGAMAVYDDGYGRVEQGQVTSVGEVFVFVRYGAGSTSAATDPDHLTLRGLTLDEAEAGVGRKVVLRELYGRRVVGIIKDVYDGRVLVGPLDLAEDSFIVEPSALDFTTIA